VTFNADRLERPRTAGDTISYAWDLDEDGLFDDSTAAQPTRPTPPAGS
jgi:hypothetical protein